MVVQPMDIYQEYKSQYDTIKQEVKFTNIIKGTAVSHIPQFGDAVSPAGDFLTSPNFGICDPTPCR